MRHAVPILFYVGLLFLGAPLQAQDFTWLERRNARHFVDALEHTLSGIRVSNEGGPGALSEEDRRTILGHWREALESGGKVRNEVLQKIHPQLPRAFRDLWQRGLSLSVRNLEVGDLQAEIVGSRLMDRWGAWYTRHRDQLRVPR